ncbi:MAG: hypothetical protein WA777_01175 [Rhodanobacter sp.]
MSIVFTLKEDRNGLWCIARGAAALFTELRFAVAIKLARQLARDEHSATGLSTCVELASPEFTTTLAQYAQPHTSPETIAA